MSEMWGVPPHKSGVQEPRRLQNLRTTLTAHIFGMKDDIDNRSSALATQKGSPTLSQNGKKFGLQMA